MKRAMRDILLLVVLLVQTSCIDNLLDYPATTKISADTFWETTEDAEKGVNAVYNAMRNAFGLFYRLDCYPNADLVYFQNANSQSITSAMLLSTGLIMLSCNYAECREKL